MTVNIEWLLCPICKNKTRVKIREDTEIKNFPLYCPKCKKEMLVDVRNLTVTVHKDFLRNDRKFC